MAIAGRKPTADVIRITQGRKPKNPGAPQPNSRPKPPVPMEGRPAALWRRYVAKAWWLTDFDSPKAWLWCHLTAEAEANPTGLLAAKVSQLRSLGSELGMDPASRARFGAPPPPADELDHFFN